MLKAALARPAMRPALFFFVLIELSVGWFLLKLFTDPRAFGPSPVETGVLALVIFPVLAGVLLSQVVQELQHCSFAWPLPGLRSRLRRDFLVAGGVVALLVFQMARQGPGSFPPALIALAFAAYCLGGVVFDPLSPSASVFSGGLAVSLLFFVEELGVVAEDSPSAMVLAAGAVSWLAVRRLFSVTTFRRKPSVPTQAMLSSFWPEQGERYEKEKLGRRSTPRLRKKPRPGPRTHDWTRVAAFESWGSRGVRRMLIDASRGWLPILAVVSLGSWLDRGELGLVQKLAIDVHYLFLRPPGMVEPPGDPPVLIVPLLAGVMGASFALFRPIALSPGRLYPLSRRQLGQVAFRSAQWTSGAYVFVVGIAWTLVALSVGALAGVIVPFDYLPHMLRCAMVTAVLLPLAQVGRLRLARGRAEGAEVIVMIALGLLFYSVAVSMGSEISRRVFPGPGIELLVLAGLIVLSYRWLGKAFELFYATEDLI